MSDWKLLNTSTASGASSVEFTDLTGYKIFKFVFVDVNPSNDGAGFNFQVNVDGQSGYNETITSTTFLSFHDEADSTTSLSYYAVGDQAQGTSGNYLAFSIGNGADESCAGELFLFNPQSTVFVKHFYATSNNYRYNNISEANHSAGYINVTGAVAEIRFAMSAGTFDGTIKQYGLVAT